MRYFDFVLQKIDDVWHTADDNDLRHIWVDSSGLEHSVSPAFYADAGTPIDEDSGDDMEYVRTETRQVTPNYKFVEIENDQGNSIKLGKWVKREDGFSVIRVLVKTVRELYDYTGRIVDDGVVGPHMWYAAPHERGCPIDCEPVSNEDAVKAIWG